MVEINYRELKENLIKILLLGESYKICIDWAVLELIRGVEDLNVCLLASSNLKNQIEIEDYINNILGEEFILSESEIQEAAGRILVSLGGEVL